MWLSIDLCSPVAEDVISSFSTQAADGEIGGGRMGMLASAHLLASHVGNEPEAISHSN